jgi:hypothetical protein
MAAHARIEAGMKSVVVIAHRRPEYLRVCLEALNKCRGIEDWRVIVGFDGPLGDGQRNCYQVAYAISGGRWYLLSNPGNSGVNEHGRQRLNLVLEQFESPMALVVEEDVILSADALELCDWFYAHPERDNYACLLLHNFSETSRWRCTMQETMHFSPWGWAVTREMWNRWFKPNWMCKKVPPFGWDWSLGYVIQKNGLKCLHPALSRVRNIGREGGVYETPEHFDEFHGKQIAHDGSRCDYKIVDRLADGYQADIEHWVKEELAHAAV